MSIFSPPLPQPDPSVSYAVPALIGNPFPVQAQVEQAYVAVPIEKKKKTKKEGTQGRGGGGGRANHTRKRKQIIDEIRLREERIRSMESDHEACRLLIDYRDQQLKLKEQEIIAHQTQLCSVYEKLQAASQEAHTWRTIAEHFRDYAGAFHQFLQDSSSVPTFLKDRCIEFDDEKDNGRTCVICTDEFKRADDAKTAIRCGQCKNIFHVKCLLMSFYVMNEGKCPTCRQYEIPGFRLSDRPFAITPSTTATHSTDA